MPRGTSVPFGRSLLIEYRAQNFWVKTSQPMTAFLSIGPMTTNSMHDTEGTTGGHK